jgi:hypothetical protein
VPADGGALERSFVLRAVPTTAQREPAAWDAHREGGSRELPPKHASVRMQVRNAVRLTLADGETLTIAAHDVPRVCENLWCFAPNVDALVVAGVVVAVSREFNGVFPLDLTWEQSRLIRQAIAQPEAA